MAEDFRREDKKFGRRTLLSRAALLGGGAALSGTIPSLMMTASSAAAESTANPVSSNEALQPGTAGTGSTIRFSKELLMNQMFQDSALTFTPPEPERADGQPLQTGAIVQSNGDILFRIYAPTAKDVTLRFQLVRTGELPLKKQQNGVFEGLLPYDENHTGPMNVAILIDGMDFLSPFLPIQWSANHARNFVEVPDRGMAFLLIQDVPHGTVSREIYWATAVKSWARCFVYSPPGYMASNGKLPVLYLQHGSGENETSWEFCGRLAYILDNLIAEKKMEPFLVVMNNDAVRYRDTGSGDIDLAFETILLESCIPHIEKSYRVKGNKWDRAIAGLSMGAYMSSDIGFRHPELFGSIGTFTASMTHETLRMTYRRPYAGVMKDSAEFGRNYKLYFRSTTPAEDHLDYFLADDGLCAQAGIDKLSGYHRVLYPPQTSKWNSWRAGLRDYAQLLFR